MHEFAEVQSTAFRLVEVAASGFGVGGTLQAADAAEGASSSAAVASKIGRANRSDIALRPYFAVTPPVKRTNTRSGARPE